MEQRHLVAGVVAELAGMWSTSAAMGGSGRAVSPPAYAALYDEILLIRREGITKLRDLDLPALRQACYAAGDVDETDPVEAPQIEALLRRGVAALSGGRLGSCASLLFGLDRETRGDSPTRLRREAAERWGVSEARFRRDPQTLICTQMAEAILLRAQEHRKRLAHLALERRLPTTSRLAVAWLERFEAYYRIWSPVTGLGGDLTAYRSTLLEKDRPYDREPGTDGPDDPGDTQENQAKGYVVDALWHFTCYLVELQRFMSEYGGLWLLSDARAEQDLADAVYRVWWHSPNNERDDSYLRGLYDQAKGELHQFYLLLNTDRIATATGMEWVEWADQCDCTWRLGEEAPLERYPTHRHHPGIQQRCQLHALVTACNDYCALVDDDWKRVADWYRLPTRPLQAVSGEELYVGWRTSQMQSSELGNRKISSWMSLPRSSAQK